MTDSPFILAFTRENYPQIMKTVFKVRILLDFWAGWCQPCQILMPILARPAEAQAARLHPSISQIFTANIDNAVASASKQVAAVRRRQTTGAF